jgi:Notch-like protein
MAPYVYSIHSASSRDRSLAVDYTEGTTYAQVSFTDHEVVSPTLWYVDFNLLRPVIYLVDNPQYFLSLHPTTKNLVATAQAGSSNTWRLFYKTAELLDSAIDAVNFELVAHPERLANATDVNSRHQCWSHCVRFGDSCHGYLYFRNGTCFVYATAPEWTAYAYEETSGELVYISDTTAESCPLFGKEAPFCGAYYYQPLRFGLSYDVEEALLTVSGPTPTRRATFNTASANFMTANITNPPDEFLFFPLRQIANSQCEYSIMLNDTHCLYSNGSRMLTGPLRPATLRPGNGFFVQGLHEHPSVNVQIYPSTRAGGTSVHVGFVGRPSEGDAVRVFRFADLTSEEIGNASIVFAARNPQYTQAPLDNYVCNTTHSPVPYAAVTSTIYTFVNMSFTVCRSLCAYVDDCRGVYVDAAGTCRMFRHCAVQSAVTGAAQPQVWFRKTVYMEELSAAGLTVQNGSYITTAQMATEQPFAVAFAPIVGQGVIAIPNGNETAAIIQCVRACTTDRGCVGATFMAATGMCYLSATGYATTTTDINVFSYHRATYDLDDMRILIWLNTQYLDFRLLKTSNANLNEYDLTYGFNSVENRASMRDFTPHEREISEYRIVNPQNSSYWQLAVVPYFPITNPEDEMYLMMISTHPTDMSTRPDKVANKTMSLCSTIAPNPPVFLHMNTTDSLGQIPNACVLVGCPYDGDVRDCNKELSDGCEVNIGGDINNCGGCGVECVASGNVLEYGCFERVCVATSCVPGYTGPHCAADILECGSDPCVFGACIEGVNGYTCECQSGYSGVHCQTNIDECASAPCSNAATCVDGVDGYSCACASGFSGSRCQTNINECASNPCQNGGTCDDGVNGFTCTCPLDYSGARCQTVILQCGSVPCQNGGTCNEGVDGYSCTCTAGYSGAYCQTDVDECASNPCQNGGTCSDGVLSFQCTCASGFHGADCLAVEHCDNEYLSASSYDVYATVVNGTMLDGNNHTLMLWHKPIEPTYEFEDYVFTFEDGNGLSAHALMYDFDDYQTMHVRSFGETECDFNLDASGWHHYAFVYFNDYVNVYVDSLHVLLCGSSGLIPESGRGRNYLRFYSHADDIRIYNGSLSLQEIQSVFADGIEPQPAMLEAKFGFTGGSYRSSVGESVMVALTGGFSTPQCGMCISSPCQNGGLCSSADAGLTYTCACASGYTGVLCADDYLECASEPCQNGGTCNEDIDRYECMCLAGYSGYDCQTEIDECVSEPCQNGGTCVDGVDGFTCTCTDTGYTGTLCQTELDECDSSPCHNGGTCVDGIASFICECAEPYYGNACQDLNRCDGWFFNASVMETGQPTIGSGFAGGNGDGTFAFWAHKSIQDDDQPFIHMSGIGVASQLRVSQLLTGEIRLTFHDAVCTGPVYDSSLWHHIAFVFDTTNSIDLYLNRRLVIENCVPDSPPGFDGLTNYGGVQASHDLDEVRFYQNTLLTPTEIEQVMFQTANPALVNLFWYFTFTDGGRTSTDEVAQNAVAAEGAVQQCGPNECASNPCLNGGTCTDGTDSYTCTCAGTGYTDSHCQTDVDECEGEAECENGSTCVNDVGSYHCTCLPGYEGQLCQSNSNECASQPCQNGGICNDALDGYTCTCMGFSGIHCEVNIDECVSNPCEYGGTCNDGNNGYTCACLAGFSGVTCQSLIDECESNPCQNGGTCTDSVDFYTCDCEPGYSGPTCAVNINDCASNPCQNAGTCTDGVNGYTCACVGDYFGDDCEFEGLPCTSSPCENGGTCVNGVGSFLCLCTGIYTGTTCTTATQCFRLSPEIPSTIALDGDSNTFGNRILPVTDVVYPDPTTLAVAGWFVFGGIGLHTEEAWASGINPMALETVANNAPDASLPSIVMNLQKTSVVSGTTYTMTLGCYGRGRGSVSTTFTYDLAVARWIRLGCSQTESPHRVYLYVDGVETEHTPPVETTIWPPATFYIIGKNEGAFAPAMNVFVGFVRRAHMTFDYASRAVFFAGTIADFDNGVLADVATVDFAAPLTGDMNDYGSSLGETNPNDILKAAAGGLSEPLYVDCPSDPSPTCSENYSGPLCDQSNLCASSPCQNSGTCQKRNNGYVCYCSGGYTGTHCQTAP